MTNYCPIQGASQPIKLDENNNFIDPVTGEWMHKLTVEEMPTKQELMLGVQIESQTKKVPFSKNPPPCRDS